MTGSGISQVILNGSCSERLLGRLHNFRNINKTMDAGHSILVSHRRCHLASALKEFYSTRNISNIFWLLLLPPSESCCIASRRSIDSSLAVHRP